MRRQTAARRDVDEQQRLAAEVGEGAIFTFDVLGSEMVTFMPRV